MIKRVFTENGDCIEVSEDGKVFYKGRELKQRVVAGGYLLITLHNKSYFVHRLVASAFIQPLKRGDRSIQVHHKNGNKADNQLSNLELLSMKDHQHRHKQKYPLTKKCEVCGKTFVPNKTKRKRAHVCSNECKKMLDKIHAAKRKKPIIQCDIDGKELRRWNSARDIQTETGYSETGINQCCRGKLKHYKNFLWKYADGYI